VPWLKKITFSWVLWLKTSTNKNTTNNKTINRVKIRIVFCSRNSHFKWKPIKVSQQWPAVMTVQRLNMVPPQKWLLPKQRTETYRQFHQHYTREIFVRKFVQSQNVSRKSCQNNVRMKNSYVKTLMKLTPKNN